MCTFTCGIATTVVGAALTVALSVVTFVVVPGVVETMIKGEMTLISDTIQMERFEEVPFPLNFTVRLWSITNPEEVISGGVPAMTEVGPYVYKMYIRRDIESLDDDEITYRIVNHFEFDAEKSYPNTEDDMVTIANVPYNAILQVAESMFPLLMGALNAGIDGIFGENNGPIMTVRVRDLLFEGIPMCRNPGLIGGVACTQVRAIGAQAQNLRILDDGTILFSLLHYKDGIPSSRYVANRGLVDSNDLGRLRSFNDLPHLLYWADTPGEEVSVCNQIRGTDSQIFPPFVDREKSLFAINTDICRSVELRYQQDVVYEGIPAVRFAVNEWLLGNKEGCFCLNTTAGITRPDGCLLAGAQELYTCVGAFLVLSYPHFLFADSQYQNGVLGMNPTLEQHRIYLDMEPKTGTVVRGSKRGQFNVFLRPVTGIANTQNLRTTLTPIFWVEEGMSLPEEFVDEISTRLLMSLRLVDILLPVAIALGALVLLLGVFVIIRAKRSPSIPPTIRPERPSQTKTN